MMRKIISSIISFVIFSMSYAWPVLGQENLKQLYKQIKPSVVTIITYRETGWFAIGSGFFVKKEGLNLATNRHVVEGASIIAVKTAEGEIYKVGARLEAEDYDLALLEVNIPASKVKALILSKNLPEVGETVAVVGAPQGFEQTLSRGIISQIRTITGHGPVLQMDAPISKGSSGGPVINMNGEVVGIATYIWKGGQNLNFAIPATILHGMIPDAKDERLFRQFLDK